MQSWQDEVEVILGARGPLTAILPSHKEPPPSVWPQSSQLYFLPTHAFKERVNTPCGALVKKPRLRRLSSSLLDDHLVSFLPLILKRDNGLLQSCLTGLLRLLRDKKRRHVLNLTTTHGSGLVMTTGLSSQVMAIETVSSHVHRNVGAGPGQRGTSMAWTTPWLRLLHPSLRWARRSTS